MNVDTQDTLYPQPPDALRAFRLRSLATFAGPGIIIASVTRDPGGLGPSPCWLRVSGNGNRTMARDRVLDQYMELDRPVYLRRAGSRLQLRHSGKDLAGRLGSNAHLYHCRSSGTWTESARAVNRTVRTTGHRLSRVCTSARPRS